MRTNLTCIDYYYLLSGLEWTCHHHHHTGCAVLARLGLLPSRSKKPPLEEDLYLTYSTTRLRLQINVETCYWVCEEEGMWIFPLSLVYPVTITEKTDVRGFIICDTCDGYSGT